MAIDLNLEFKQSIFHHELLAQKGIQLKFLRLDTIHPVVSGNKWFKLKEYIALFQDGSFDQIITFGGAYSNHLIATAAACQYHNIPCRGIVRGFHGQAAITTTLQHCRDLDMELHFLSRAAYATKNELDFIEELQRQYPGALIIPEGGSGSLGLKGARQINDYIDAETELICCAVGSGTTFCGIADGLQAHQSAIGFTVMKNGSYMQEGIQAQISHPRWRLETDYHFGGFAKHTPELIAFIHTVKRTQDLPLDFVYNAKMLWGVLDLIATDKIKERHILCIHTGGLQGNQSIPSLQQ
ncbi:1-aminocyclopropane-1-carboxylate deaminase [Taibaiella sp. KBW10]|uniref:1-aminocyclopropane-1-carboxylate deaminase/D-cysteine desulfhydrase n=1 Tax=Taibaiella sp. KBW10 TaxID=2153357 RepID=UPI000F599190|nr:pyridoxal-phosphate dependent enzyme [Taibaiella sp. KBW10]RQO29749.1 1-aminocyclopropane-1-carboxylate deaminase [Taibaiella sp. KBW10]